MRTPCRNGRLSDEEQARGDCRDGNREETATRLFGQAERGDDATEGGTQAHDVHGGALD
jgi:hypothetical protein